MAIAIKNNMDFVSIFEQMLCQYTGFQHAICVDSCTSAIIISLESRMLLGQLSKNNKLFVPKHTYLSVPMSLQRNGWQFTFVDNLWEGFYSFGYHVFDASTDFQKDLRWNGVFTDQSVVCVSFQQKKRLNLDQGGVILTDSIDIANLAKRLRHDGRDSHKSHFEEVTNDPDQIILGWHAYMSPEKAAKGIMILNQEHLLPPYIQHTWEEYPDISKLKCFADGNK